MILSTHGVLASQIASFDADAVAFFNRVTTAGGSLSNTEKVAVNQLVLDMKSYNIWSAMKAVYPMVGASAAACAQNLVSSSFTGTFLGGVTYASTGVTFNGSTGYFDSNLIARNELSNNNAHLSTYCRSNNSGTQGDLGRYITGLNEIYLQIRYSDGKLYASFQQEGTDITGINSNSQGNYIMNRTASNLFKVYKNSSIFGTNTNTNTGLLPNQSIYLGQIGVAGTFSDREYSFCTIGNGLTDTEAGNFYTAVQAFQTTLGRQV